MSAVDPVEFDLLCTAFRAETGAAVTNESLADFVQRAAALPHGKRPIMRMVEDPAPPGAKPGVKYFHHDWVATAVKGILEVRQHAGSELVALRLVDADAALFRGRSPGEPGLTAPERHEIHRRVEEEWPTRQRIAEPLRPLAH